jgi:hypothetical protein
VDLPRRRPYDTITIFAVGKPRAVASAEAIVDVDGRLPSDSTVKEIARVPMGTTGDDEGDDEIKGENDWFSTHALLMHVHPQLAIEHMYAVGVCDGVRDGVRDGDGDGRGYEIRVA